MRKKRMPIIIILLILIAGGLYLTIKESKKIVISQEVRDRISISDLSLHVDQLLENGFDNDGFSPLGTVLFDPSYQSCNLRLSVRQLLIEVEEDYAYYLKRQGASRGGPERTG